MDLAPAVGAAGAVAVAPHRSAVARAIKRLRLLSPLLFGYEFF
ncbi:hypothetical protein ADILRU_0909 [Leifsonia rubra CMS 76R]|nr:hypothetical protein ADILRU_0909 [Leifsonia rubra CMS 76R]